MKRTFQLLLFVPIFLVSCATMRQSLVGANQNTLEKLCEKEVSGACALLGRDVAVARPVAIMQSVTSAEQSRFAIVLPRKSGMQYFMVTKEGFTQLPAETFTRSSSSAQVDQLQASGLKVGQNYDLLVIGPDGTLWDKRGFRALDLNRKRARFAITADMDDSFKTEQTKMWSQVLAQRPDVILMIGDNVYPDREKTSESVGDRNWRRYVETRESLTVFKANPLIPVLATWDDHDYGTNNGDRTFTGRDDSQEVFFSFFPQRLAATPAFDRGPGISSWWNAFGVHFAFLDNRSFRSPNNEDVMDQTHFGVDQEKWLGEKLHAANGPVFLVSGDQFFGGYHTFESFEGNHPKNFQTQLSEWKKMKVPLVFLSGDRHVNEIIKVPPAKLGYQTYELTASPIHAPNWTGAFERHPSPNKLVGVDGKMNYSMVEILRSGRNFLQFEVQAFSLNKEQVYQKTLTVKQ